MDTQPIKLATAVVDAALTSLTRKLCIYEKWVFALNCYYIHDHHQRHDSVRDKYILRGKNKYTGNTVPVCLPISAFLCKCDMSLLKQYFAHNLRQFVTKSVVVCKVPVLLHLDFFISHIFPHPF